eukprot:11161414-Lingulodinium_polyedra.AAC.1
MLRVTTRGEPVSDGMCELCRRYVLTQVEEEPPAIWPAEGPHWVPLTDRSSGALPRRTGSALAAGPA